jgi:hypothetical protein
MNPVAIGGDQHAAVRREGDINRAAIDSHYMLPRRHLSNQNSVPITFYARCGQLPLCGKGDRGTDGSGFWQARHLSYLAAGELIYDEQAARGAILAGWIYKHALAVGSEARITRDLVWRKLPAEQ